ncbi:MAG: SRPBCC family protein [Planctomycetes bacterium]|nr:SRPBCC family protein [Planctomycetota bacterium]
MKFKHLFLAAILGHATVIVVGAIVITSLGIGLAPDEEVTTQENAESQEILQQVLGLEDDSLDDFMAAPPETRSNAAPAEGSSGSAEAATIPEISDGTEDEVSTNSEVTSESAGIAEEPEVEAAGEAQGLMNFSSQEFRESLVPLLKQGSLSQVLEIGDGPNYPSRAIVLVDAPVRLVYRVFTQAQYWAQFLPKVESARILPNSEADLRTETIINVGGIQRATVVEDWTLVENERLQSEIISGDYLGFNLYDLYAIGEDNLQTMLVHTSRMVINNTFARLLVRSEKELEAAFNLGVTVLRAEAYGNRSEELYRQYIEHRRRQQGG